MLAAAGQVPEAATSLQVPPPAPAPQGPSAAERQEQPDHEAHAHAGARQRHLGRLPHGWRSKSPQITATPSVNLWQIPPISNLLNWP